MPAAIDSQAKKQVINQWLSGDSRDRIAADNGIGAGTVSNIINEWKKGAAPPRCIDIFPFPCGAAHFLSKIIDYRLGLICSNEYIFNSIVRPSLKQGCFLGPDTFCLSHFQWLR
jgi:hypothetical protein